VNPDVAEPIADEILSSGPLAENQRNCLLRRAAQMRSPTIPAFGDRVIHGHISGHLDHPSRLRLRSVEDRAHHRTAEQDRALAHRRRRRDRSHRAPPPAG
jgi:hypothetical protein